MWFNIVCTSVEAGGLLLIIAVGARFWGQADLLEIPPPEGGAAGGLGPIPVMQAAVLTFFSFIGFEDILNVSEEVKNQRRNVPLGMVLAMTASTLVYITVAVTALSVVPWRRSEKRRAGKEGDSAGRDWGLPKN